METALLRLMDNGFAEWIEGDQLHHAPLETAAQTFRGKEYIVLVPGRDVLLTKVQIPSRRRSDIEKALPYTLEDWLIHPVESQHIIWKLLDDGIAVAIVSREIMGQWVAELSSVGITPAALIPDTLAIPWQPNEWTVIVAGNSAWLRTGTYSGQSCDRKTLPALIGSLWSSTADEYRPACLRMWCFDGSPPGDLPLRIEMEKTPPALGWIFRHGFDDGLSLLEGSYAMRSRHDSRYGPWRTAVVSALILLCSALALHFVQYFRVAHEETLLQSHINQVFHRTLPDVTRIVNPHVQMAQALASLRSGTDQNSLLFLLSRSSSVFTTHPGIQISELTFNNDRLDMVLTGPGISAFEQFRQALLQQRLDVNLGAISKQNKRTQAHMTIQEKSS